jgi:hypothetical protein
MRVKKAIKEIVGEFRFERAYSAPAHCTYTRIVEKATQTINIGKSSRFDKEIGFALQVDSWNNPHGNVRNVIPELAEIYEKPYTLDIHKLTMDQIRSGMEILHAEMQEVISKSGYGMSVDGQWP